MKFAQDETQYGFEVPKAPHDAQSPPLSTAIQEQMGLKLKATRGTVLTMVVDEAGKPQVD